MQSTLLGFFSTRAGKKKIQTGTLSQTELFIYFYIITIYDFFVLTQQTLDMIGKAPTFLDYQSIWQFRIVSVVGLVLLFLVNGGSKGRDFFSKYFTFSFTVGIKYFFVYIILGSLPFYLPMLASNYYEVPVSILIDVFMVANIGLRIYQTKT